MYAPLCEAWPLPPSGCPSLTGSPAVTGAAVMAASEVLWALSGRRFGDCSIMVRPCRTRCGPSGVSWWNGWWWDGGWPDVPFGPTWWLDAVCGRCGGGCSCTNADTLMLPSPAQRVTQVLIDGVELAEGSGWALYDGTTLVRTDGGLWPLCQDWTIPVSGVGAWSVTAVYSQPVPMIGQLALGELAAELTKACNDEPCRLPRTMTSNTRQGVAQQFPSVKDLMDAGMAGLSMLPVVRTFLGTVNPDGIAEPGPRIWNPDDYAEGPRRPGGVNYW